MEKSKRNLKIRSFSTTQSTENPDILTFSGVAGFVDTPTDATPCGGSRSFSTCIDAETADVQSLVGSGVNVEWGDNWGWDFNLKDHSPRFKVGVVDKAWVKDNEINIEGHLWKYDFPDVCDTISCAKDALGFSVELYAERLEQDEASLVETVYNARFTGVAILYKDRAAFKKTSIACSIMEANDLNDEMKTALEELGKAYDEKFAALTDSMSELTKKVESLSATQEAEQVADEPKQETAEVDFSAQKDELINAVREVVKAEFAAQQAETKVEEPERKTQENFASTQQFENNEKSVMELSADIDNDTTLSAEQKWAKQLALWNEHRDEFAAHN